MFNYENLQSFYKAQKVKNPWAVARSIVDGTIKGPWKDNLWSDKIDPKASEDDKRSMMGKIVAGIEGNPYNKSTDEASEFFANTESLQKLHPLAAAAIGWMFSDSVTRGLGQPTAAQQREFERQIQQAMRKKGRAISKDDAESAMSKMQAFFQKDENDTYVRRTPVSNAVEADTEDVLQKIMSLPPFAGARFDPSSHRWVKPENIGQTYAARGGKKRVRASGTGAHERSVSGHGKGRIRGEGAGRKYKGETDVAASRRKEGFTHDKPKSRKKHR